jgi:signal transduction histidine kinase
VALRPKSVTLLAAVVAGGLTDLIIFVPSLHFAYRSVALHAMLETAAALISLLTTFLLWGRLRQRQRLDDLLLFVALGVLSFTSLFFAAVPAALWTRPHVFSIWTTVAGSALGAALLAASACVPRRKLARARAATVTALLGSTVLLLLLAGAVAASAQRLPIGIDPGRSPANTRGWILGNGLIVSSQLLIAVLLAIAAVGFTRRAEREGDELLLWLGAGAAVAAVARINYFIFPSLYSEWVYAGDAFRLVWHVLLFVGAAREIQIYQHAFAESRVVEERRRMARELHDGLAQELAFIANTAHELSGELPAIGGLRQVVSAAQRGLDEARRAIAALSRDQDEPFDVALVQAVEEVGRRLGARVEVAADDATVVEPGHQEQLLRIVREAVTNAARHANADLVRVQLTNGGPVCLRIEDDGVGFDPGAAHPTGFGLVTMRERAAAIGGDFNVSSRSGEGTVVEVRL